MPVERYHDNPNKTVQLATFMLEQGKSMTAREVYEAGFRYRFGAETTVPAISTILNKLHQSDRFCVERRFVQGAGPKVVSLQVKAVIGKKSAEPAPGSTSMVLWRQLLTRQSGESMQAAT
ncbi:hypothetical protein [Aeromonas salmonicida]|uniref:hypothetical protein n=1 Tax=Aeromonas salmonicida TaxID=645 RepID=UPI00232E3D03|nr:hypothetical protein [Aeromonas salmonicida]WCH25208.1 hypothetical protein ONZ54_22810 [Aeromonas salmonicida]